MAQIAMIIPFFGKFPVWMDLYLYSCSTNPMVDFHFYTDCDIPQKVYSNTFFHKVSFSDYCALVSRRLHIDFKPIDPYKLTDLKPFYGYIHKKELTGYSFWGYSDIDLVYSDIASFLTPELLNSFDFITTHNDRPAGHFSVIRYNSKYTDYAFKISDWKKRIESQTHYSMDEDLFGYKLNPLMYTFNEFYLHIFSHLPIDEKKLYEGFQQLSLPFHKRVLMTECFSTPTPHVKDVWVYDTQTHKIDCPSNQKVNYSRWGRFFYLHFLFFKQNKYKNVENYWRDDFYQIPQGFDFEHNRVKVEISNQYIRLSK